ncbi:hypothetical protein TH63_07355 [Rufibacter radiotolerans]|uniref:Uncharacterized protein n=1 Tax=Rufibacter radiotolerans TaxID=1379910 RepID=A0A0H4VJF4_9BACT|nr:hypothetical protein [Rufibacter radiotolerans]AKQ45503.1 hypothetical protein TH63_07355 [Rufibacter radiotolerans]
MDASHPDIPFLQELYGQDTLYFIPEPISQEAVPLTGAAVVPSIPANPKAATPEMPSVPPIQPEASVVENSTPVSTTPTKEPIKWLGEAVKGTYLLFDVPEDVFQQLPQHLFLQKVMAAVGLTTRQIQFGKLSTALEHDVKQIAAKQQAQHIILFGQGLPVANLAKMEFYRMYRSGDSRFVLVDSLADIEKSVDLKKKLWDVLQKIFLQ